LEYDSTPKTRKPLATPKITRRCRALLSDTSDPAHCEAFEKDCDRKVLVVMATGAGKTRTVIALCDLLMDCNVGSSACCSGRSRGAGETGDSTKASAASAESAPVNLLTKNMRKPGLRLHLSTMMVLIDEAKTPTTFRVGHFDLSSSMKRTGQFIRVMGQFLLTSIHSSWLNCHIRATKIDRDTYGLFDLEKGVRRMPTI